jgi:hypothetical protein
MVRLMKNNVISVPGKYNYKLPVRRFGYHIAPETEQISVFKLSENILSNQLWQRFTASILIVVHYYYPTFTRYRGFLR